MSDLIEVFKNTLRESELREKEKPYLESCGLGKPNIKAHSKIKNKLKYTVTSNDSLYDVRKSGRDIRYCVLNFADPVTPGGYVWDGAETQEEDLCRQSTLYLSLYGELRYYRTNRRADAIGDDIFSYLCLYSPHVEIVSDDETDGTEFAVLSSAAPIYHTEYDKRFGGSIDYEDVFRRKIHGILNTAEVFKEENLVLGAYGCVAFGNDPEMVASAFKDVLQYYEFKSVRFNVMVRNEDDRRNYEVFKEILG